jgi:hypothetical protein
MNNELSVSEKQNLGPLADKIEAFATMVEVEQFARLASEGMTLEVHRPNYTVRIRPGAKYIKVDVGFSGKYMVEISTGNIFGIKAYGQIHRGHAYGNLDTIAAWDWSGYVGRKLEIGASVPVLAAAAAAAAPRTRDAVKASFIAAMEAPAPVVPAIVSGFRENAARVSVTVSFANEDDARNFRRYVAAAKEQDGTLAPLWNGIVCAALKHSEIVG